jgi:hypothetical protein
MKLSLSPWGKNSLSVSENTEGAGQKIWTLQVSKRSRLGGVCLPLDPNVASSSPAKVMDF